MEPFDPYHKWLGIPPEEQPPHHYRLLGIGLFESDPDVISGAADRQMVHVRSFQSGKYSELSQRILNELAAARLCLLDAEKRAAYDQLLRARLGQPAAPVAAIASPVVAAAPAGVFSGPQIPPPPPPTGTVSPPGPRAAVVAATILSQPVEPAQPVIPAARPGSRTNYARAVRRRSAWQGAASAVIVLVLIMLGVILWALNRTSPPEASPPDNGSSAALPAPAPVETQSGHNPAHGAGRRARRPPTLPSEATSGVSFVGGPAAGALPDLADPVGRIGELAGHAGTVCRAVFVSDDRILSGGEDGTVRLWAFEGGEWKESRRFEPGAESAAPVVGVASSVPAAPPEATGESSVASPVSPPSPAPSPSPPLPAAPPSSPAAESPPSADGALELWPVRDVDVSPDGQRVMVLRAATSLASVEGVAEVWSIDRTKPEVRLRLAPGAAGWSCRFSPKGDAALLACDDGGVRLVGLSGGGELRELTGHGATVRSAVFDADAGRILSGSDDRTWRLFSAADGQTLATALAHEGAVRAVAFSPDGRRAVSAGDDGVVRLWSLPEGRRLQEFRGHRGAAWCVDVSPDGRRVLSGGEDGFVRLWRIGREAEQCAFDAHRGGVRGVGFSANGRRAVSAGADGAVRLWGLPPLGIESDRLDEAVLAQSGAAPLRAALPEAPALEAARRKLRDETYRDAWAKAVDAPAKAALSRRLLDDARKPHADPAVPFALFELAEQVAVEAGDIDAALAVVDERSRHFQVERHASGAAVLECLAEARIEPAARRLLCAKAIALSGEALADDQFDAAERAAALAVAVAEKAHDVELSRQAAAQRARVEAGKAQFEAVRQALDVLSRDPADARARETVGRHECFVKGDWKSGLARLAGAEDETLRSLAARELAKPGSAAERVALADGWWDFAAGLPDDQRAAAERHAGQWYRSALDELSGAERQRVERRLAGLDAPPAVVASSGLPPMAGYECRRGALRQALLAKFGGDETSEAVVARALAWLAAQQQSDGSWSFDNAAGEPGAMTPDVGTLATAPNAATALVLLPFLCAGNTQREGEYRRHVMLGVEYLKRRRLVLPEGWGITLHEADSRAMPSHALATILFCELCDVSRDKSTREIALGLVQFIVASQNADGGWGTTPPLPGYEPDPSNLHSTGWNVLALRSAQWVGLPVPPRCMSRVEGFLDAMAGADGSEYRRAANESATDPYATAMGFLCRAYTGWGRDRKPLADYVAGLEAGGPQTGKFYWNFLAAQLARDFGGSVWDRWNPALRGELLTAQSTSGVTAGSWYVQDKEWGNRLGGRLFTTALATLTLQVYYRNPPAFP